jgi:diguanylate cyclase (GGDEF)-like protein/PAS domain S-box-containing protein
MSNKPGKQDVLKPEDEVQVARVLRATAERKIAHMRQADYPARLFEEILRDLQVCQVELEIQNDELKRAHAIMEEYRERYLDCYDIVPVGCITLSQEGMIDEINPACSVQLGHERGKLLSRSFADFIAPEDRDHWDQYFIRVLQRNHELTCELALLRGDGSRQQVQLDSTRLLGDNKLPVVRIMLSDIAERKRAEKATREREEFFRMIAENLEDFIAVLDLDGRRLYNNPSYARLFGDLETMKGTDSFADIHPDDREHIKRLFKETVQGGIGLQTEYRFVRADGNIRYMESSGALIKNSRGQASSVLVVSRDITERKQAEEQILNLAFYDTLTQLPNRRMLDDRLNQTMAASKRSGRYGALMFLDMDNFKPLNDLHGHGAGDLLLREVARRISSCVRGIDTVARFGGDEFVVVLGELDTDKTSSVAQVGIVAEKIRAILAKPYALKLLHEDGPETAIEYQCTSSIGVIMFINHECRPADLLGRADRAMYQAKESGRNQVRFFNMGHPGCLL